MPRMRCPGCKRVLRIDESKRGAVVGCPKCRERFAVPRFAEDDEPLEEQPAEYALKNEPDAPRPKPPPLEDEDDDDDARPRRRGQRRAQSRSGLPNFLTEWNFDKALVVGSVGVGLLLCGMALVAPVLLLGLIGAGIVMLVTARVWALVAAFSEDGATGCTTIIFPWYGMFNLEDKRPLFLFAVGVVYILLGIGVGALLNAVGRFH